MGKWINEIRDIELVRYSSFWKVPTSENLCKNDTATSTVGMVASCG